MKVVSLEIPEVKRVEPRVFGDHRGFFFESFHVERYASHGIPDAGSFVQDNVSRSARGILRGLHLQHPRAQGKLVSCLVGAVFDVAVDVRVGSPTFGKWVGARLDDDNRHQLWVPAGFAHGFQVLSESAIFAYKCTELYYPKEELAVRWDDPAIGIAWPGASATLSEKDANAPLLADLPESSLPTF